MTYDPSRPRALAIPLHQVIAAIDPNTPTTTAACEQLAAALESFGPVYRSIDPALRPVSRAAALAFVSHDWAQGWRWLDEREGVIRRLELLYQERRAQRIIEERQHLAAAAKLDMLDAAELYAELLDDIEDLNRAAGTAQRLQP